jgi:hypothetical protein
MEGRNLAYEVYDLLMTMDLSERIANSDLAGFSVLLHTTRTFDEAYLPQLLVPLGQPHILSTAIKKSSIKGIGLLIYQVAQIDKRYLQDIQRNLEISHVVDELAMAPIGDIGHFLWNVFEYIDPNLAQECCRVVDDQQRSRQLRKAPLEDLCLFLWNLIQISDFPLIKTLDNPIVEERLVDAWSSDIGLGAQLLGILAIGRPKVTRNVLLPPIEIKGQKELLLTGLQEWLERSIHTL